MPMEARPEVWTMSGTTAYRSLTHTGTKNSQVWCRQGLTYWMSVQSGKSSVGLYPDSGDGSCVAMAADKIGAFWDDKQCSEKFFFFCEKFRPDITPPTKAPTPPPSQGCADGWTAQPHFRNCYKVTIQRTARTLVNFPTLNCCAGLFLALPQRGLVPEEELGSSS